MPQIGEQADVLRALGRFLDDEGVGGIEVQAHEVFLAVTWGKGAAGPHNRVYQEHDLEALRAHARTLRGTSTMGRSDGVYAELLRSLGQQLDEEGGELNAIYEEPDGFRVSSVGGGIYRTGLRLLTELTEWGAARRAARGTAAPPEVVRDDPFGRVTVGAAVFTRDNQRLGKVGDVQERRFKVDPGFLQRGYWLPAECVEAADRGEPVLLSVPKSRVYELRNKPASTPQ